METTDKTKWAFRNDYDSKKWELCGCAYDEYEHQDNGQYKFTWAYLSDEQKIRAFENGKDGMPEQGYCYVMLKNCKVRQSAW